MQERRQQGHRREKAAGGSAIVKCEIVWKRGQPYIRVNFPKDKKQKEDNL